MTEFDTEQFEQLMHEGVIRHNQGDYQAALDYSVEAYNLAPSGTIEQGRAARDNGARHDRLGHSEEATHWAMVAHGVHRAVLHTLSVPNREAYRESAASDMYLGMVILRPIIEKDQSFIPDGLLGNRALIYERGAWAKLTEAKKLAPPGINQKVDQYEINAARRVSITESLVGSRTEGLLIGAKAVRLAFMSESPRLDTSERDLSSAQRLKAKAKALAGGVAALAINTLASPLPSRRRQVAFKLAGRTL